MFFSAPTERRVLVEHGRPFDLLSLGDVRYYYARGIAIT